MLTNLPVPYDLRVSIPISLGVYFTYQQKALVGAFSVIMIDCLQL